MSRFKRAFSAAIACLLVFACIFALFAPGVALAQPSLQIEPVNPAFTKALAEQNNSSASASSGHYGGLPSPVELERTDGRNTASAFDDTLPAKYNTGRTQYQTAVKNQYDAGSCWAFSSLAAMESFLLKTEGTTYNFAERNLMNSHGFDYDYMRGGTRDMAVAYLARWAGPVYETDDYAYYPGSDKSNPRDPTDATKGYMPDKIRRHVQDTAYIEYGDFTSLKKAVREYGAAYASLYMDESNSNYYNASKAAYCCNYSTTTNHVVTLVGWDDSFSRYNFSTVPKGNGAFIAKNSWGSSFGKNGYFYISYYDANFGKSSYVFKSVESANNYTKIYQYDPLGWVSSIGYGGNTAWFSNVFTVSSKKETLRAVSFYTTTPGASYEVYVAPVVSGAPPSFAGAVPVATGTQDFFGYHTVKISPVTFTPGTKFAVAVKVVNSTGYNHSNYPVAVEKAVSGYSSGAKASPGQSYVSYSGTSWDDLGAAYSTYNVCLKAFTVCDTPVTGVKLDKTAWQLNRGATLRLTATVSPTAATNKNVTWSTSKASVATVSSTGLVTAKGTGTATITVTTKSGGKAAKCKLTVVSPTQVCNPAVSNVNKTSLRLSWTKLPGYSGVTYYIYYANSVTGSYKLLTNTTGSYKDIKNLAKGKTYYFKVRAKVKGVLKEYSTATPAVKITN